MPVYPVKEPGFFGGVFYHPEERNKLVTSTPFPKGKKPSWVGPAKKAEVDFSGDTVDAAKNLTAPQPVNMKENDPNIVTNL